MSKIVLPVALCTLLAAASLLGCAAEPSSESQRGAAGKTGVSGRSVQVFAAASTANALDEIVADYRQTHDVTLHVSYAASSTLAQQIVHGAGADVFLSANRKWADYLDEHTLVASRRDLLGNRLVVVVPAGSPLKIETLEDLLAPQIQHLAVADPGAAPAGIYAKQALTERGLWSRLETKIVAAADVRFALVYVETGAAEAGIVYATDAAISDSVNVAMSIDPGLTEPIRYPLLLLAPADRRPAAESFFQHLSSPQAAKLFQKHGFTVSTKDTSEQNPEP